MIIYDGNGGQYYDFESALDGGRSLIDSYDIWDKVLECESFSVPKLIKILGENYSELIEEAVEKWLKEDWVPELITDEEDEDEFIAIKEEAGF